MSLLCRTRLKPQWYFHHPGPAVNTMPAVFPKALQRDRGGIKQRFGTLKRFKRAPHQPAHAL